MLVTSLKDEVRTIAQHYRDRGDAENNFDELKNQWGWAGFTTQDRKRCQIMGRIIALVYNWWTIFMRLGIPDKHAEAITSRPLALHGIARQTRHGNQTTVEITSTHAKASQIAEMLTKVSGFLKRIKTTAEQLTQTERWRLILSAAFRQFLGGKVIGSTGRLADKGRERSDQVMCGKRQRDRGASRVKIRDVSRKKYPEGRNRDWKRPKQKVDRHGRNDYPTVEDARLRSLELHEPSIFRGQRNVLRNA